MKVEIQGIEIEITNKKVIFPKFPSSQEINTVYPYLIKEGFIKRKHKISWNGKWE